MAAPRPPAPTSPFERLGVFGGILAGALGLLASIACVAVPLLHFVLGPLGPVIGGFIIGRLGHGSFGRLLAGALTMAVGMAMVAFALTGALFGEDVGSGWAWAAPVIAFLYTAALGSVGAFFGAATAPHE